MTKKERALAAVALLEEAYPQAVCSLEYEKPYELLIATRLSAQCTDARVNLVTKDLFARFPSLEAFAQGPLEEIERLVHPCGLYKTKARDIQALSRMLLEEFGGQLPDSIEQLTRLPGVGRKTANLIMGDVFGQPSYVCDTHCIRITNRLGLTQGQDPAKVETQLRQVLPPEKSGDFCHRLVLHGRAVCKARGADCGRCVLTPCCKTFSQGQK